MNNYVYLAGPISGLDYKTACLWRESVQNLIPYWVETLSPMRGKDYLNNGKPIADHDITKTLCTIEAITARDYNDVKRSAVVLVNLLGTTKVSIGTVMEIAWAKALNIPCVLVMEKGNIHEHAMIIASCGFVCSNLSEAIKVIATITGSDAQVKQFLKDQIVVTPESPKVPHPLTSTRSSNKSTFYNSNVSHTLDPLKPTPSGNEQQDNMGKPSFKDFFESSAVRPVTIGEFLSIIRKMGEDNADNK